MCTVTYFPLGNNDFILTSSRDVPYRREKSLYPKKYIDGDVEITYPKDGKAGGTWIGYSNKKRLICLLNGGFENHYIAADSNIVYRKSRGIIVLDLLKEEEITSAIAKIDLQKIEPFTLVIVDWNNSLELLELVWDGTTKHLKKLPQENRIWSSSTLYDATMKQQREEWFANWDFSAEKTTSLNFHYKAGIGDCNVAILMKREKVGTVSITQVSKVADTVLMEYKAIS